jgi:nucleotide-binding universal stress UspA family protein
MFKKILIAVDGSEPSIYALSYAADLANEQGAELTILSVVPRLPVLAGEELTSDFGPQFQDELNDNYVKMLKKTDKEIKKERPELKTVPLVLQGNPGELIVDVAATREVDLIIIGNRGTSGVLTWMLGSTSRHVVERCTVPVLVVKDVKYCEIKKPKFEPS